MEFANNGDLF